MTTTAPTPNFTTKAIALTPDDRAHIETVRDTLMDVCALLGELNETGWTPVLDARLRELITGDGVFNPLGREVFLPAILYAIRRGVYETCDDAEAITEELEAALLSDGCGGKGGAR